MYYLHLLPVSPLLSPAKTLDRTHVRLQDSSEPFLMMRGTA